MKPDNMFLNDLYKISQISEVNGSRLSVTIELDPEHKIFKGHFPDNPILPGVCTVQILKELLMYHFKNKLHLEKAGTIKNLSFINPRVNNTINFDIEFSKIENNYISCNAVLNFESASFFRFKGEFKVVDI